LFKSQYSSYMAAIRQLYGNYTLHSAAQKQGFA
jgi:hypothetical protein